MRKILLFGTICFFLNVLTISPLSAQQTRRYDEPAANYHLALELLYKEKYGAAQELFGQIIHQINDPFDETQIHAAYYHALCAYELQHKNATDLYTSFIHSYPENSMAVLAQFQLAKLHYRNKEYKEALDAFKLTDIRQLTNEERNEYYFKTGYCYLKGENLPQAEQAFLKVVNAESKYQGPANYYYAHIAYQKNDFQKALEGFERLTDDETFGEVVPYYILQIKYKQQLYQEVIDLFRQMTTSGNDKRDMEIVRMAADAYFKTGQYNEAGPLLERYSKASGARMTAQDWYQLGYIYYETGEYTRAINAFQKTTTAQDSLSQNAFYHLGYCYIQTNQKQFGLNAFLSAYKMNFDNAIKQDALFNYAKLAYELSFDPYNEAIKALRQYINDYPESDRVDEANLYLVNLFMSTSDYNEALTTIEKIRTKDEQTKAAYQQIAYCRGIELFNGKDYSEAMKLFKKSLEFPYDKNITAANYYWIAECYYRLESYEFAIEYYKKYQSQSAVYRTDLYYLTSYNLGYAFFNQKNYALAITHFQKFISTGYGDDAYIMDAYLRIADGYFINKSYDEAINYYNKALEKKGADSDYALLQKAMAIGGKGNFELKASLLKEYLTKYPRTTFTEEVLYELGTTYLLMNRNEEALTYFKKIPQEYPSGKYVKKSLLKSGLIYYDNNSNDLALNTLKKVISDYPGLEESREALEIIRNIYVDLNRVNDYLAYSETLPFADISKAAQDSLSYYTAENRYMKGDCPEALKGFSSYIENFSQGSFLIQAHYYKSECDRKNNNLEAALDGYKYVLEQPPSQFTESALVHAANIVFDQGEFNAALNYYKSLEGIASNKNALTTALTGLLRCNFLLDNYVEAIHYAEKVIANGNPEPELEAEAYFVMAKSALATGNTDQALEAFNHILQVVHDERAAESQYHIASIFFTRKNYQEAEKQAFALINQYASFDFWVAKGFILLSGIYMGTGNLFQAKQTLQSIIDHYPGEDLRNEAILKLNTIISNEKETQNQSVPEAEKDND